MCAARAPPAAASSAPHEWRYRAEGGVHAVFAYAGAARALRGAVLRVRKRRASDGEAWSRADAAAWEPYAALGSAPSWAHRATAYLQAVAAPLLAEGGAAGEGGCPGDSGAPLALPAALREGLLAALNAARGEGGGRVVGAHATRAVEELEAYAVLERDKASVRGLGEGDGPRLAAALCVELKPKCGLPALGAGGKSRYALHQALKARRGEIGARSAYEPQDLFAAAGGDRARALSALRALLATPQNNLTVFDAAGRRVYGGDKRAAAPDEAARGALGGAVSALLGDGNDTEGAAEALAALLAEVLLREPHLRALLALQRRGGGAGVGGGAAARAAGHARLLNANGAAGRGGASSEQSQEVAAAAELREFLVAHSANDCGLMVALARAEEGAEADSGPATPREGCSLLRVADVTLAYRVSFVDLDIKPTRNLERAARLEADLGLDVT